ncbi:hypothetical protein [Serratia marcescens]|uniref:hypothetical protein n=1 Tax=Serratia marcescens TaxID=615 RepID=UPI00141C9405|nr:hypothetical protein [Serratia marcescens]CAB1206790.1 hypothetical protein FB6_0060 [Serratia marcescens]
MQKQSLIYAKQIAALQPRRKLKTKAGRKNSLAPSPFIACTTFLPPLRPGRRRYRVKQRGLKTCKRCELTHGKGRGIAHGGYEERESKIGEGILSSIQETIWVGSLA